MLHKTTFYYDRMVGGQFGISTVCIAIGHCMVEPCNNELVISSSDRLSVVCAGVVSSSSASANSPVSSTATLLRRVVGVHWTLV